jgi:chorismate dehydratase
MVYGIERAGLLRAELLLSPPSGCAEAFASGRADVALLPSAALLEIPEHNIITSFCIGAVGDVRTVVIVGDSPISNVRRLFLDSHSLTSVALSAILCRELWRIEPERIDMSDLSPLDNARTGDAFLLIGDKVFDHEGRFGYSYDLARAWRELTGLPFVFALWVASPDTQGATTAALEGSLCYGVEHIAEAVAASPHCDKPYAVDYLTRNIDYNLDEAKRRSLELFLHKCKDGYSAPQNVTL